MIARISRCNDKIGETPNINLNPYYVCQKMKCLKEGCYALKAFLQYPPVRENWTNNIEAFSMSSHLYFLDISNHIQRSKKKFFRWHSAGEIVNQEYLNGMFKVANENPSVKFLCFTKKYYLDYSMKPANLEKVFSSWPTMKIPLRILDKEHIAWMEDGSDPRISKFGKNPFICPGKCEKCRRCWSLSKIDRDVVFHKH